MGRSFNPLTPRNLLILGIGLIKELAATQATAQDQHNQLREDVRSIVRFIQPGGYSP